MIDLESAKKVTDITVGPHLSHPEAIAVDPKADRAYVAIANSDQVAVIDTEKRAVERTISVGREEGLGTAPVALTVTPDGRRLLVALSGADAIAVIALPAGGARASARARARAEGILAREAVPACGRRAATTRSWRTSPPPQYPTDVQVVRASANPCGIRSGARRGKRVRRCQKVLWLSGKGLGTGPNPKGPQPDSPADSDDRIGETQYLPLLNVGAAGLADWPSAARLRTLSRVAHAELTPVNAQPAPRTPRCDRAARSSTSSTSSRRTAPTTRSSATSRVATATRSWRCSAAT